MRKCARLLALDYCIYSTSLLSASATTVAPAAFTTHELPTISLTLMTQNQAHASTSPVCNNPWLDHHSNGSCWDGGLTWLTLTCNPSSLAESRMLRQKLRQGVRNRFRWIPPCLGRLLCTHAPRPPRRKRGLALLRQDARRPGHPHTRGSFLPAHNHLIDA